jgi:hypothetical protein
MDNLLSLKHINFGCKSRVFGLYCAFRKSIIQQHYQLN